MEFPFAFFHDFSTRLGSAWLGAVEGYGASVEATSDLALVPAMPFETVTMHFNSLDYTCTLVEEVVVCLLRKPARALAEMLSEPLAEPLPETFPEYLGETCPETCPAMLAETGEEMVTETESVLVNSASVFFSAVASVAAHPFRAIAAILFIGCTYICIHLHLRFLAEEERLSNSRKPRVIARQQKASKKKARRTDRKPTGPSDDRLCALKGQETPPAAELRRSSPTRKANRGTLLEKVSLGQPVDTQVDLQVDTQVDTQVDPQVDLPTFIGPVLLGQRNPSPTDDDWVARGGLDLATDWQCATELPAGDKWPVAAELLLEESWTVDSAQQRGEATDHAHTV